MKYGCTREDPDFTGEMLGTGATLLQAYEALRDACDSRCYEIPAPESCEYFELKPVLVDVDNSVRITQRFKPKTRKQTGDEVTEYGR